MNISNTGKQLIAKWEGNHLSSYRCPANVWTIGIGHTGNVKEGQTITQAQCDALFQADVKKFVDGVNHLVKVPLNQNQFDALVSFCFNLGCGALDGSHMLDYINKGDFKTAATYFDQYVHARVDDKLVTLPGLVARRNDEQALFLKPVPAPAHKTYTVIKGDTLIAIAKNHGTDAVTLAKLNHLPNPNVLHVGQKLILPH